MSICINFGIDRGYMSKKNQKRDSKYDKKVDRLVRLILILACVMTVLVFAVRPMFFSKDYYFDAGDYSFLSNMGKQEYDVAILGGSVEGASAAIGAAKVGAKVVILCEGPDLCPEIKNTLNPEWDSDSTNNGVEVSSDLFKQICYEAGENPSVANYQDAIKRLITDYKVKVIYNTKLSSTSVNKGIIKSLQINAGDITQSIYASTYVDATKDGLLLKQCKVNSNSGYYDIGLNNLFPPLRLNFLISGVNYEDLKQMIQSQGVPLTLLLQSYHTDNLNISVQGFNIYNQGDNNAIIEGITVFNVDYTDPNALASAYNKAKKECESLFDYLKLNVPQFYNAMLVEVAKEFVRPSAYHYNGIADMSTSDVFEGDVMTGRLATIAKPIVFTLEDGISYIIANPKYFFIPVQAIVPQGVSNLAMVGDKVGVSSILQPAISNYSALSTIGNAAGVVCAYSVSEDIYIDEIAKDPTMQKNLEKVLRKSGIYMTDIEAEYSFKDSWSYPYIKKLLDKGLLTAGVTNDFKLDKKANSEDFAYLLLNGVVRSKQDIYSFEFDSIIRQYLNKEPLTKELFAEILLKLNNIKPDSGDLYSQAINNNLIDDKLQKQLKSQSNLTMQQVYYAAEMYLK